MKIGDGDSLWGLPRPSTPLRTRNDKCKNVRGEPACGEVRYGDSDATKDLERSKKWL